MTDVVAIVKLALILGPAHPLTLNWASYMGMLPEERKEECVRYVATLDVCSLREGLFRGRVKAKAPVGYRIWIGWVVSATEQAYQWN